MKDITNMAESNNKTPAETQLQDLSKASSSTQPSPILVQGIESADISKLSPKYVEQFLLTHPVVPRGIDIKANRMTGRGYKIVPADESEQAKDAANKMSQLIEESGGTILLNGWIRDAFGFGNGYLSLLEDENTNEIVYLAREHPMFLRISRKKKKDNDDTYQPFQTTNDFPAEYGEMEIDPITKKPLSYTQVVYETKQSDKVKPINKPIPANRIGHLVFDTWGDEAEGIALVQYLLHALKYILNIEEAGAEAIYRSGFTQKVFNTTINNEEDLEMISRDMAKLSASDALILPDGISIENLKPGETQMSDIHDIFLTLLAIRLGVPKPILTLDGTDTNKATMRELMRDLIYDIVADELKVTRTIEKQIFTPACASIYGDDFNLIPKFVFLDFDETLEEKALTMDSISSSVQRLTDSYTKLIQGGQIEAANQLLRYMMSTVDAALQDRDMTEVDELINPPKQEILPSESENQPSKPTDE